MQPKHFTHTSEWTLVPEHWKEEHSDGDKIYHSSLWSSFYLVFILHKPKFNYSKKENDFCVLHRLYYLPVTEMNQLGLFS